jgi:hypothetical protein
MTATGRVFGERGGNGMEMGKTGEEGKLAGVETVLTGEAASNPVNPSI